jgi:hypothetical protein
MADVGVHQPGLIAGDLGKRFLELNFAVLGGLDLGSGQD